jgi:glucosamine-6-phosphate deaminase
LRVVILENADAVSKFAANLVVELLQRKRQLQEKAILGLATGGTPLGLYRELIERYRSGQVSFRDVHTFNLDEYVGLAPDHVQSYHYYMHEHLFRHIDIDQANTHVPKTFEVSLLESACRFESAISAAGGIDLQVLGIGTDGHIGFNEIGSSLASRTRVKTLTQKTRMDNARYFSSLDEVPRLAVTMGIGTILESRSILLLATGLSKAATIRNSIEGSVSASVPASALQLHPNVTVVLDTEASSQLAYRDYYLESERLRPTVR